MNGHYSYIKYPVDEGYQLRVVVHEFGPAIILEPVDPGYHTAVLAMSWEMFELLHEIISKALEDWRPR